LVCGAAVDSQTLDNQPEPTHAPPTLEPLNQHTPAFEPLTQPVPNTSVQDSLPQTNAPSPWDINNEPPNFDLQRRAAEFGQIRENPVLEKIVITIVLFLFLAPVIFFFVDFSRMPPPPEQVVSVPTLHPDAQYILINNSSLVITGFYLSVIHPDYCNDWLDNSIQDTVIRTGEYMNFTHAAVFDIDYWNIKIVAEIENGAVEGLSSVFYENNVRLSEIDTILLNAGGYIQVN
jgi:hypothetical protein